ncbi:hypothetical protein QFC19_005502 [Naganishia cerealis]|uniref:Uncharacterized protein n=1 Tax=Naganishia cerealis TaxID=610337 RepID=A0ACC2VMZ2_9TREE|nr:hypothetical protein QFC19_005502 [Naganishia cerealis]
MGGHRQPASLQVQARSSVQPSATTASTALEDVSILRQSQQFKRDIEREAERWMDVLMESPSVDRRFLRRASLYLQPHTYDEVTHERHLAEMCCYPTCKNSSRRPYTEDARWRITNTTSYNDVLRGPKKRDLVECIGNPQDGFCNKDCAVRSRWYRSRLNVEPIWARARVNAGDLASFQKELKLGHPVSPVPEEVDLMQDMEDKGEIIIQNGELHRCSVSGSSTSHSAAKAANPKPSPEVSQSQNPKSVDPAREDDRTIALLSKTEIVAESREAPSTFMQRLEQTLSSLRILEHPGTSESSKQQQSNGAETSLGSRLGRQPQDGSSSQYSSTAARVDTRISNVQSDAVANAKDGAVTDQIHQARNDRSKTTAIALDDEDYDEAEEDEETRMAFNLALAAREQLEDGTF